MKESVAMKLIIPFVQVMDKYEGEGDTRSMLLYAGAWRMVQVLAIHLRVNKDHAASDAVLTAFHNYRDKRTAIVCAKDLNQSVTKMTAESGFEAYFAIKALSQLMKTIIKERWVLEGAVTEDVATELSAVADKWLEGKPAMTSKDRLDLMDDVVVDRYEKQFRIMLHHRMSPV